MTTLLPGFRQFRFPAKLFTFTALGLAALAGMGWDGLHAQNGGAGPLALAWRPARRDPRPAGVVMTSASR